MLGGKIRVIYCDLPYILDEANAKVKSLTSSNSVGS